MFEKFFETNEDLFKMTTFEEMVEDLLASYGELKEKYGDKTDEKCCGKCDNCQCKKKDKSTYEYYSSQQYENGKLVGKTEKEYVDGKCTKDVDEGIKVGDIEYKYNENEKINCAELDKDDYDKKSITAVVEENNDLKYQRSELQNQINEMANYIDGLNEKIKTLEIKNGELTDVINNMKVILG